MSQLILNDRCQALNLQVATCFFFMVAEAIGKTEKESFSPLTKLTNSLRHAMIESGVAVESNQHFRRKYRIKWGRPGVPPDKKQEFYTREFAWSLRTYYFFQPLLIGETLVMQGMA